MENDNNNINAEDKQQKLKETEDQDKSISVEEFEEEENDYYDENLVDNDDLELINKHFDIQIVRGDGTEMDVDEEHEPEHVDFKKEYENFEADGEVYSLGMNDKGICVLGDGEDTTYFYDLNKKELIRKEKFNKDSVVNVAFSNDLKYCATASLDGSVNLFNGDDFTLITTVNGSFSDINVRKLF
jgi:WD40 repeat protein